MNTEQSVISSKQPTTNVQTPTTEAEINLLDGLLVLVKHWKMIGGVSFLVAVVTILYTLSLPNIYTAKTLIVPGGEDKGMMGAMMAQMGGLIGLSGGDLGGASTAELYITMLKSEVIRDKIIDRFKLLDVYDTKLRSDIYSELEGKAFFSVGKKDGVLIIAVDDKNPKQAAAIANGYAEELGKLAAGLSMTIAARNRTFLEGRLTAAKADLVQAENAIKAFQSKYKAINVTEQAKASIEGVAGLRAQLAAQEIQLATLQRQFTDNSQEVKTARATISNIKVQIARLEGSGGSDAIPSVGSVPHLGQEYVRLMREFRVQESLVELLTKQYEINKLSEEKDVSPFQVIQKAKAPEIKSKPKRGLMVIMTTFASAFLMLLIAFIRESCTRMSDRNRKKLQMLLGLCPLSRRFRRTE